MSLPEREPVVTVPEILPPAALTRIVGYELGEKYGDQEDIDPRTGRLRSVTFSNGRLSFHDNAPVALIVDNPNPEDGQKDRVGFNFADNALLRGKDSATLVSLHADDKLLITATLRKGQPIELKQTPLHEGHPLSVSEAKAIEAIKRNREAKAREATARIRR